MASSHHVFETPPRTAGRNRFNSTSFTPSQQLGGRDVNEQINQGYDLPPELRQAAQVGFGGGGFGQGRQQDPFGQSGFQIPAAPGSIAPNMGIPQQQNQTWGQVSRVAGPRGTAMMAQPAGRMAGGPGDTQQAAVSASLDKLPPIPRAARTINENLNAEQRYPDLDTIVSQGQSADYDLSQGAAWAPFKKINTYHIPDAIFEQYNQAQCHTMMGLFTEIGYAWMTVDNRLYVWEYATGNGFQGYESQPNTITAVKLVKPRPDVFNSTINYVLVIATSVEVLLLSISASPNGRG